MCDGIIAQLKKTQARERTQFKMATYAPKTKAAKEKELSSLEIKLLEKKQESARALAEQMRQVVLQEYDELVKAGKQEEADALRDEYPKHFPERDFKGLFQKWKEAIINRAQREEMLSVVTKKVEKLQRDIEDKSQVVETFQKLIQADKKAMEFCSGMVFKQPSKSIAECEAAIAKAAVEHHRSLKERKKKIEKESRRVEKESQELEISAMKSESDATDDEGILFRDINLSTPTSASSH